MGITIHYSGSVKSKDDVDKIISYAKFFAESLKWETHYEKYKSVAYYEKLYKQTETGERVLEHKWLNNLKYDDFIKMFSPEKLKEGTITETESLIINPTAPFNTESIDFNFFEYKGAWHLSEFCKTQVFSDDEISNLIAHELIITLLTTIKNTWMPNMRIYDEGDFYKSSKPSKAEIEKTVKYFKEHNYPQNVIDNYIKEAKEWKPYNFNTLMEAHGANLNLINTFTDALKNASDGKLNIETPAKHSFIENAGKKEKNDTKKDDDKNE